MAKQSKGRPSQASEKLNPGVRTDREQVQSRSADPGQSSYGGFKDQDPRIQHQSEAKKDGKRKPK